MVCIRGSPQLIIKLFTLLEERRLCVSGEVANLLINHCLKILNKIFLLINVFVFVQTNMAAKQCKDLRSLCLKIISFILSKFEDHDFSPEFWDLFFMSVKPLVASFKQEGASSEKASSLFSCFLAMSRSSKLVPLLSREKNLVPDVFSMLAVSTASDAIVSSVLKFVENLLYLDIELGNDDNPLRRLLLPHVDVLVCSLHHLFVHDGAHKRYDNVKLTLLLYFLSFFGDCVNL